MRNDVKFYIICIVLYFLISAISNLSINNYNKKSVHYQNTSEPIKSSYITINENGTIDVVDSFVLKNRSYHLEVPLALQNVSDDIKQNTVNQIVQNMEVYCNEEKIEKKNYTEEQKDKTIYEFGSKVVNIYNVPKSKIEIKYTYNIKDVISQYNNSIFIKLNTNIQCCANFSLMNFDIVLPKYSEMFKVGGGIAFTDIKADNHYFVQISESEFENVIDVEFDKGIIDEKYIEVKSNNNRYTDVVFNDLLFDRETLLLVECLLISLVLLIIFIELIRRPVVKEANSSTDNLINPILAETIIDKKTGLKELIMTGIMNLIYKKKIKNVGNEKIVLVDKTKLNPYEKLIVSLIFKSEDEVVFDDLKRSFDRIEENSQKYYESLKGIKEKIEDDLYIKKIYSSIGKTVLKVLKYISFIILGIVVILLCDFLGWYKYSMDIETVSSMAILYVMLVFIDIQEQQSNSKYFVYILVILYVCGIIELFTNGNIVNNLLYMFLIFIILLINIIIIKNSNSHVFTKEGKKEYAKVAALKNYIENNSFMNERELEGVVVWDEYFVYAVAFGLVDKVYDKFDEDLLKMSATLYNIFNR